jgi:hypothetical protein
MRLIQNAAFLVIALLAVNANAALVITEVMSSSKQSGAANGDWFELTNTGASSVNLNGYYWDDNGPSANDGSLFPEIIVPAGESIIILDEDDAAGFVETWGITAAVYPRTLFGGEEPFSGLGSGGDQIEIWDTNPNAGPANLVASAIFGAATQGFSFEWDLQGNSLGLSVAGENGALLASGPGGLDVGSPGRVPEPSTFALAGVAVLGLLAARQRLVA